ncbi:xyloglucan-specific galacturonosyltransferase 1-like [Selaginella moellendorffii]|uniref:xyloglucan-specific galacturonosyltransferase 1-like n=1 Tax=Selaginella moellendorffii TaxID=88036 RepID=UPI000D1CB2A2|nr:xyloglucan-specific galacturonosyltransferase 1-like [Selaginella moellendorffii]XP_024526350.1 xyloglucan-specific galacturonosyltransferase 1-like [Selaginella moellendorffii]XP_024526351.1 xyloglucan-specific galacturonosyltransferase 1-like [Selaginella moellendorffii]XP_024526352.1 xyloglucan-specific galacturonosyltransferase 1-like [Selaginella moellendorffii]|eukprot:XP_024526349.1 xyloglucan-specific galacturonosyltransferase 1-like [Selaginella moellendorffii]
MVVARDQAMVVQRRTMAMPLTRLVLATLFAVWVVWNFVPLEQLQSFTAPPAAEIRFSHSVEQHYKFSGHNDGGSLSEEMELGWKKKEIIDSLRGGSDTSSRVVSSGSPCSGRAIYIYKLPERFNRAILEQCGTFLPWFSMCDYFTNSGMGVPVQSSSSSVLAPAGKWFQTNQYALDVLFHQRLLHYPCLTDSPEEASLFYVPYYAGLDVLRYHYTNETLEQKNELGLEVMDLLKRQQWWWRRNGRDHLLVMGKITWDFRRNNETMWGNTLLKMAEFENMTKLLLERDPFEPNEIAVPHPTYFHPSSDSDISTWISRIASSSRDNLVSFAGMPRDPEHLRTHLINQCKDRPDRCKLLACSGNLCDSPEPTMELFLSSQFCMQPPGDSATRRSVFDSLIAGCIPVLFDADTAYFQYAWHLPEDSSSYSVFVSASDVKRRRVDVVDVVEHVSPRQRLLMRRKIIEEIVPGLLYAQPGTRLLKYRDAFDTTIARLLQKGK